ncbi:MAG: GntR family transcriptional regulator [Pseudomonadota bacterium]
MAGQNMPPLAYSLPEQIAEHIAQAIIFEQYEPDTRLKEVELAAQFEVSRAPVREALRILESRGLIKILPQKGAQVTHLTADDVVDLFEIRAALLGLVIRRMTAPLSSEFLENFDRLVEQMEGLTKRPDTQDLYTQVVFEISRLMISHCSSERLVTMVQSFSHQTARYHRISLSTKVRRQQSAKGWRELYKLFEQEKLEAAEELIRSIIMASGEAAREKIAATDRS